MRKLWVGGIICIFLLLALISFIPAPNNDTNSSSDQNQTQNNTNITCTSDDNCSEGKECENNICVTEDEEDNETNHEDNDNNETEDEDHESNETDNENKVCCLRTIIKDNESYQKYNFIEKDDCLEFGNQTNKKSQIVNDDLCKERNINKTETKEEIRERQRVHFEEKTGVECPNDCICTGVVMKCVLEDGTREMKVYASSGNLIVQIKDTNISTTVTLYKDENGTLYIHENGKDKEIKVLPDQAKEKVKERLKQNECDDCENIKLNEDAMYEFNVGKKSRLFWIFPVSEKKHVEISAENGEITKFRNPWWGFLAKDSKEELLGSSCITVTPGYQDECCQNKGYDSWNSEKSECE